MTEPSEAAFTVSREAYAEMAAELVSAYVAKNSVPVTELPTLIRTVHETLVGLGSPAAAAAPAKREPAVPIKKSVTEDYIISLEDGRKLKSMKRYLAGLGMTPEEYRSKWNLPRDYPMTAPRYSAQRSELAKTLGLGRKVIGSMPAPDPVPVQAEPELPLPAAAPKRGRAKKAA